MKLLYAILAVFLSLEICAQEFTFISLRAETYDSKEVCKKGDAQFGVFRNDVIADSSRALLRRDASSFVSITRSEWQEKVKGKSVLIVVHGMAKSWEEANKDLCNVYWNIAARGAMDYDMVVGVTWPGDDYLGISPYFKANRNSLKTAKVLGEILKEAQGQMASMDILTHSMGSKVSSKMLKSEGVVLRNAFYLAPSILRNSLKRRGRWSRSIKRIEEGLYVFYSDGDWAFNWTSLQHIGMGYQGIKRTRGKRYDKLHQVNCNEVVNQNVYRTIPRNAFTSRSNHSYYTQCKEVFDFISTCASSDQPAYVELNR